MKRVLYLQYVNPAAYPPLGHSSRLLARDGWEVLFLGVKSRETERLTFTPHESITISYLRDCAPGWRQKLHYLKFMLWAIYWTLRWRPRWLYASDFFSCPPALLLSFFPGLRVIYHEHDTHTTLGNAFLRSCQRLRHWLAPRAELCVLPNRERAESFQREHPQAKVLCVWNCPDSEEVAARRPARREAEEDFWLLYHGSIVPVRIPPSVLHALQILPVTVKLRIIGYETIGQRGYIDELQEIARRLGVEQRIEFIGSVPRRSTLLEWGRKSDVGLAFMPKISSDINMQHMTGASNKPFDYMACGLALLVTDSPDWHDLFVAPGYGLACDQQQHDKLAATIRWLFEHRAETREMGERGRQRILTDWNYEAQFAPVLALMNPSSLPAYELPTKQGNSTETA
jgi:glycosyltransferase involved in cell wall biosynthesis